jgi:hypothetical protein
MVFADVDTSPLTGDSLEKRRMPTAGAVRREGEVHHAPSQWVDYISPITTRPKELGEPNGRPCDQPELLFA